MSETNEKQELVAELGDLIREFMMHVTEETFTEWRSRFDPKMMELKCLLNEIDPNRPPRPPLLPHPPSKPKPDDE
jgi:hypothetical protein